MRELIHRDASSAWNYLCTHGGIELNGRDEGLDERVKVGLDPAASSLKEALLGSSMESFARAFFKAIHPFLAIFHDILDFFKQTAATQGQSQWTIRVGDVDLDLEHFRKWVKTWADIGKAKEQIPAIDESGMTDIFEALRARDEVRTEFQRAFREANVKLPTDVQEWTASYNRGDYEPMPQSLTNPRCPTQLRPSAAIVRSVQRIRETRLTREELTDLWRKSDRTNRDPSDALDFWGIAGRETDYWLRSFVIALSAAATLLKRSELNQLGKELAAITDKYPLRPFDVSLSIEDLESVLSLPIWKKRCELYSVWIATELVRALKGHRVQLHHNAGRIAFSFHETLIATIHSSPGPFTLVSERRSPLANPQGAGRVAGVQPDHALWTIKNGTTVCRMAVEVKHYKKSANQKFVDVFNDYARAFPEGTVYLVSHGPVGKALHNVSDRVRERCHAIGHLVPSAVEARQELAKAVRDCVGEPIEPWPSPRKGPKTGMLLVFDVSDSMISSLSTSAMEALVRRVVETERPEQFVAVSSEIVGSWPATEDGLAGLCSASGGGTALAAPVQTLLQDTKLIILVTDSEGLESLGILRVSVHKLQALAPPSVLVRVCAKAR